MFLRGIAAGRVHMKAFETESLNRMAKEISGFVDDIAAAIKVPTGIEKRYSRIFVFGMGASSIAGRVYKDSTYYASGIPVVTLKPFALPDWVDEDCLLIVCSYSGNTFETVEMYKMARACGMNVVAVTRGGILGSLAEADGSPIARIGGDSMQPRSAVGWFLGITGGIIEDAGGPAFRAQIEEMIPRLRAYKEEIESEDGIAWEIARSLNGRFPVIYGTPDLMGAAVRWKNQLNENSKLVAFSGPLPEFDHNEIVGWCEDPQRKLFYPIIIEGGYEDNLPKILDATVGLVSSRGVDMVRIRAKGKTPLEESIYMIMLGDNNSLYLASISGVDPCDVRSINELKRRLKEKFPS